MQNRHLVVLIEIASKKVCIMQKRLTSTSPSDRVLGDLLSWIWWWWLDRRSSDCRRLGTRQVARARPVPSFLSGSLGILSIDLDFLELVNPVALPFSTLPPELGVLLWELDLWKDVYERLSHKKTPRKFTFKKELVSNSIKNQSNFQLACWRIEDCRALSWFVVFFCNEIYLPSLSRIVCIEFCYLAVERVKNGEKCIFSWEYGRVKEGNHVTQSAST